VNGHQGTTLTGRPRIPNLIERSDTPAARIKLIQGGDRYGWQISASTAVRPTIRRSASAARARKCVFSFGRSAAVDSAASCKAPLGESRREIVSCAGSSHRGIPRGSARGTLASGELIVAGAGVFERRPPARESASSPTARAHHSCFMCTRFANGCVLRHPFFDRERARECGLRYRLLASQLILPGVVASRPWRVVRGQVEGTGCTGRCSAGVPSQRRLNAGSDHVARY